MRIVIGLLLISLVFADRTGALENGGHQAGRIEGSIVTADTGLPLDGASIEVRGAAIAEKRGSMSDAEGHFGVEDLPFGEYAVTVSFVGYLEQELAVEVAEGDPVQLRVEMVEAAYQLAEIVVSPAAGKRASSTHRQQSKK